MYLCNDFENRAHQTIDSKQNNDTKMEKKMMRKIYLLLALTMMMVQGAWAEGLNGSGTSADPYLIENNDDWETFATSVTNGNSYSGKFVKLEHDINTTVMAGNMSYSFDGTFDGGNFTITFNKGTSASPFAEDYCAPFRMVTKATIKNLKTEGTIYTNKNYAAGIVAQTNQGTNTLENCHSGMNIISTFYGGGIHGGLVAEGKGIDAPHPTQVSPNVTEFRNCSFYGSLQGGQTNMCSGLMGYTANTARFYDCLFVPSEVTISTSDCYTFGRGTNIDIENCYYLQALGEVQGSPCYSLYSMGLYTKLVAGNGENYYGSVTVSGLKNNYYCDGSAIDLGITVKSATGIDYELGNDYTLSIKRDADNATVTVDELTQVGTYTLTINAVNSGRCVGSSTPYQFTVNAMSTGSGTADAPFIIDSADDWNTMAAIVADGKSFSGKYVQLNANITVSTMVGTDSEPFSGSFDGNRKTLTLSLGIETSPITEDNVAPFRFIDGATIQNLFIDGAVYTAGQYASCLVGKAEGTCLIKNCKNEATLSSSVVGEGYHGSYVGNSDLDITSLTIEGCVFAGSLLGTATSNVGGFVGNGWLVILKSCLFIPASITMSGSGSSTFNRPNVPQVPDAFYSETLGDAQCNRAYSISAASDVNFGSPTVTYDVSGIDAYVKSQGNATTTYLLKYNGTLYGLSGQEISFTIEDDGLNHCSIAGDGGLIINPEEANGQYTFTMPEANVTVYAIGSNVEVTVGSHGLSSFCSPYDLDFTQADEGVKAYVVSGFSPTTMSITLTQADYVPAGTGLVVTGEQGTYNVPIAATDKVWANLLVGAVAPTPITTTDNGYSNFILGNGSQGWNWYASAPGTLPAGKAYLRLPTRSVSGANHARSFTWIFEDIAPSGIQEVQTAGSQTDDAWYTLDGIRMAGKPTSSGIYVNHGKKHVIK